MSKSLAELPAFQASLNQNSNVAIVEDHAVNTACYQYRDIINSSDEGIHLVNRLPMESLRLQETASDTPETADNPTHALFLNRAIPINSIEIKNNVQLNGSAAAVKAIVMNIEDLPESLGRIQKRSDGVYLISGEQEIFLNDKPVAGEQLLGLGDRIRFASDGEEISLIQVANG